RASMWRVPFTRPRFARAPSPRKRGEGRCGANSESYQEKKRRRETMSVLTQDAPIWQPPATWSREQVVATSEAVLAKPAGEVKEVGDHLPPPGAGPGRDHRRARLRAAARREHHPWRRRQARRHLPPPRRRRRLQVDGEVRAAVRREVRLQGRHHDLPGPALS